MQEKLRSWRDDGIFLALCSRNEMADVKRWSRALTEFPLRLEDFSVTAISWRGKADGIREIADVPEDWDRRHALRR